MCYHKRMIIGLRVVVGLCFGSFVNALIWRLHEQEKVRAAGKKGAKVRLAKLSIVRGRSMCSHCGHVLGALDLIPVVSWVWLRGRCRYCHYKIEDSPAIELVTAALFVASYLLWPVALHGQGLVQFCFWLAFVVGFVALAVYDLRWFLLPDKIVFPLIGLAVVEALVLVVFYGAGWQSLLGSVCGVLIASGLFFVLFQVSAGKWIGGGDVKLGVVLGVLLGGPVRSLLLLFLASALGTLVSMPLLAAGKAKRTTLLPFGPFLLLAAAVVELFGAHITDWLNGFIIR